MLDLQRYDDPTIVLPSFIDLECEQMVLGAILLDPAAMVQAVEFGVLPAWFWLPQNQMVYRTMQSLHELDKPIDLMSVMLLLQKRLTVEQVAEYKPYLVRLIDSVISSVHLLAYLQTLKELHQTRSLVQACQTAIDQAARKIPPAEIAAHLIANAEAITANDAQGIEAIQEVFIDVITAAETTSADKKPKGLSTGFYHLDQMLAGKGFGRKQLHIVAGRAGMGKTTFLIQSSLNHALAGLKTLVFSLEMSREDMGQNYLANLTDTDRFKIARGDLEDEFWASATTWSSHPFPLRITDDPELTIDQIRSQCYSIKRKHGLDVVYLDYLQLISPSASSAKMSRTQEIGYYCKKLIAIAKKLDISIIALSQISRAVEGQSNKRPLISHLGESGQIENFAHTVSLLYRDAYYNPDTAAKNETEVILAKNRSGKTGTVRLTDNLAKSSLRDRNGF